MKTFIRLLSLLLVIIMLASCFIACNDTGDGTGDGTTPDGDLTDLNLKGQTYAILSKSGTTNTQLNNFEVYYDDLPEDVVGQAVYNRNQALKNKYGFSIINYTAESTSDQAKLAYETGDDLYDLVIYQPDIVQSHAQEGYLLDLNEFNYIDLENDSWSQYINEQLTIGGKLYYTTNDFLLLDKARAFYLFYNRDLASDYGLGRLEDKVYNNTWTLEEATGLAKKVSNDANNNGPSYEEDIFGFTMGEDLEFIFVAMGSGFRFTEKSNSGFPKLVGANEKMLNILQDALDLAANKNYTWVNCTEEKHCELLFLDGRSLLLNMTTRFIEYQYKPRESKIDLGILPYPKYDVSQEQYCSTADSSLGAVLAIPFTVQDEDMAGFCLEAITEASTDTSYRTYIDTKCKYQDATDQDCAKMMDICFENQVYDIGSFLFYHDLYKRTALDLMSKGKSSLYKSTFESYKTASQSKIDELIASYS